MCLSQMRISYTGNHLRIFIITILPSKLLMLELSDQTLWNWISNETRKHTATHFVSLYLQVKGFRGVNWAAIWKMGNEIANPTKWGFVYKFFAHDSAFFGRIWRLKYRVAQCSIMCIPIEPRVRCLFVGAHMQIQAKLYTQQENPLPVRFPC